MPAMPLRDAFDAATRRQRRLSFTIFTRRRLSPPSSPADAAPILLSPPRHARRCACHFLRHFSSSSAQPDARHF